MTKRFRLSTLERKVKEGKIECKDLKVGTVEITRTATGKKETVEVFTPTKKEANTTS